MSTLPTILVFLVLCILSTISFVAALWLWDFLSRHIQEWHRRKVDDLYVASVYTDDPDGFCTIVGPFTDGREAARWCTRFHEEAERKGLAAKAFANPFLLQRCFAAQTETIVSLCDRPGRKSA